MDLVAIWAIGLIGLVVVMSWLWGAYSSTRKAKSDGPQPSESPSATRHPQFVKDALELSLPNKYHAANEIDVVHESGGSFEVRSNDGTTVSLTGAVAKQVHRYLAPLKGCLCVCEEERGLLINPVSVVERNKELYFKTETNIPGYQVIALDSDNVALRDEKNTTLGINKSGARKVHVLMRPSSCQCGCLL
ncbi:hypothetical protein ACN2CC_02250 [Mesorhizobium muleiense]|uniref:hypothetical protein n=1 Tax=Mesorhizobium muleiense TaxID=1004279 RepID=UPI003AFACADA